MSDFSLYFQLGWQHICNLQGYDHIMFVAVLCGTYLLKDWRKVLILVTAFTIGHSLTLALSVLRIIKVNASLIEFFIPLTIVITCLINIFKKRESESATRIVYSLALFFGLIHGLGFSNYLKSLLGSESNIIPQLFAFNIGLEFGQIIIVLSVLLLSHILIYYARLRRRYWVLALSSIILISAVIMCLERFSLIKFK